MATSHLMTGTYFPHFGLDSSIFQLSFGEFFSYFAISWKWYCLTFWNVKKSALFRRLFQYSVICHYSQYIKLALTDFNKNWVFYSICTWLQLSQIWKKFTEGNGRKTAFIFLHWRHKNPKNRVVKALRASLHVGMRKVVENLRLSFEVQAELWKAS